jgi:hypothetical protein
VKEAGNLVTFLNSRVNFGYKNSHHPRIVAVTFILADIITGIITVMSQILSHFVKLSANLLQRTGCKD